MADVSTRKKRINLSNGKSALVRFPNFDEVAACLNTEKKDKVAAYAKLFDAIDLEKQKITGALKFSFGVNAFKGLAGSSFASVISEDQLSPAAAEAWVAKQEKAMGLSLVAIHLSDEAGEFDFLFIEPEPGRLESFLKSKTDGAGIDADLAFVRQHRFFGDLEMLKRECPLAIASLANALAEVGGVCLEATVGEA